MSLIQVKFDHKLTHSDIIIPLTNSSRDEIGDEYMTNQTEIQQTTIYGIQSPLIMINKIVVDFSDVVDFELNCIDQFPTVKLVAKDRYNLISTLDTPGIDNELRIQILPKFENKYKKINLTFYITSLKLNGGYVTIAGEYKIPKFTSSNIKSFGEINTYKLFESIAMDSQLGFATNIEENDGDKRWVYCDNKSYKELLFNEIKRSGTELQICDYWIDWWNNLVLADIYERYNSIDKDEDIQIWIAGPNKEIVEGTEIKPMKVVASLTNNPSLQATELYIKDYKIINSPGPQIYMGTDKVYAVYETSKTEYLDHLIQDGDTKKDIFMKYEYLGEVYGSYNYLLSSKKRDSFFQKINSNEKIEITIKTPLLGLMRGNKANLLIYRNDSHIEDIKSKMKEENLLNELESNIPLPNEQELQTNSQNGEFVLDKTLSGQYLITGCKIGFRNHEWDYKVILNRPSITKPKILKEDE